jgi:hypothetical protein
MLCSPPAWRPTALTSTGLAWALGSILSKKPNTTYKKIIYLCTSKPM